jgi:ribonuclease J
VIEAVPTGRLAVDGDRLLPLDGDVIAARRRMMFNGVVLASVALDKQGRVLGDPQITAPGLFAESDAEPGLVAAELRRTIADLPAGLRGDDETLRESLRAALRKALGRRFKKRPNVEIHVIRV